MKGSATAFRSFQGGRERKSLGTPVVDNVTNHPTTEIANDYLHLFQFEALKSEYTSLVSEKEQWFHQKHEMKEQLDRYENEVAHLRAMNVKSPIR